jgi:hypothetical protein
VNPVRRDHPDLANGPALNDAVSRAKSLTLVARRLDYMIGQVTPDEFAWEDAHYDRDSVLGQELLFLIANDDWIRTTSEIIDIDRSDAIETTIEIDVDLSRITHEAFRDRTGQIWLPIVVLPPLRQRGLPDVEPFSTLTVTDSGGCPLMTLSRAEVRHQLAAALTEIIVNVAVARLPDINGQTSSLGRDHRLVLSAAIYRLLRDETVPAVLLAGDRPVRLPPPEPMGRIDRARDQIGNLLGAFARLLLEPVPPAEPNRSSARQLTERAIQMLNAVARSAVVVVPARREQPPTVVTVRLPGRALHLAPAKWADVFGPHATPHRRWRRSGHWRRYFRLGNWILPSASLHLDLLLPSASADRQVRVNLPGGISPDPSRLLARRADLDIRCQEPQSMDQLATITRQLLAGDGGWPDPLRQSLADLALAKVSAVESTLRDHHAGADSDRPQLEPGAATKETREFRSQLHALGAALHDIAVRGFGDATGSALARAWGGGGWLALPMQRRSLTDTISPGVVAARARAIDDPNQRSAATSAKMEVRIAVTDSVYFAAARLSGRINSLFMAVVLGFFVICHLFHWLRPDEQRASPEVIALVLTLFSAIQLGRIERSDRSIMRGVLVPAGSPLIIGTILPTVIFAVAIAITRTFWWVVASAAICIAMQLAEQRAMALKERQLLDRGNPDTQIPHDELFDPPLPEPDLLFYTDAPDYAHDHVLHSGWWRTTTAEALMMGRPAYGYVIWQHNQYHPGGLGSLLDSAGRAGPEAAHPHNRWPHWLARAEQTGPAAAAPAAPAAPVGPAGPVGPVGAVGAAGAGGDGALGVSGAAGAAGAADQARSPLGPVNVLALQRSGTGAQSLSFAVFRDEPDPRWVAEHAVPVKANRSLLTLTADVSSMIGVFVGLQPGLYARIDEHPMTLVLKLAARCGLVTYETQLPMPAPDVSYADLQWGRIELNIRPEDLDHIHVFLAGLLELTDSAVIAIRTRGDGIPRILNPRPWPSSGSPVPEGSTGSAADDEQTEDAADRGPVVLATDLDIVARSGIPDREGPAEAARPNWRVLAICTDWRIGVEWRALSGLDQGLALIGVTTTVLYGQSVLLLLCHTPTGRADGDAQELGQAICFEQWQSTAQLGRAAEHPLLRVHLRTPDRSGATVGVIDSLCDALAPEFPGGLARGDLPVWYARAEVRGGNIAHLQLTIMLPIPAGRDPYPAYNWSAGDLWQVERRTLVLLAARIAGDKNSAAVPVSGADTPPDTIVQLGLLRMPDLTQSQVGTSPYQLLAEADGSSSDEEGRADLATQRGAARARTWVRILTSLVLLFAAIAVAMFGVIISGAPFLAFGPNVVFGGVSAGAAVASAVAAIMTAASARKTANPGSSPTKAKGASKRTGRRPHLLTPEEFAQIEARRRKRSSRRS